MARIPENAKFLMHFDENIEDVTGQRTATVATGSVSYDEGVIGQGLKFNGSTCLTIPLTDDLKLGSNDFTIAFWVKWTSNRTDGNSVIIGQCHYYNSTYQNSGIRFNRADNGNKTIGVVLFTSASTRKDISSTTVTNLNEWYHIAIVRHGSTISLYVNGVLDTSIEYEGSLYCGGTAPWTIGGRNNTSATTYRDMANAIVDELIFVNGTALWTEDFEPPIREFGAVDRTFQPGIVGKTNVVEGAVIPVLQRAPENAKLLMHCDENILDATGQRTLAVATGSVSYAEGVMGQGVKFNGSSVITTPMTDDLKLGSNDFTIAFWVKWTANRSDGKSALIGQCYKYNSSNGAVGFRINRLDVGATKLVGFVVYDSGTTNKSFNGSTDTKLNEWYHVAVVRHGNTISMFLNGKLEKSQTFTGSVVCGGSTPLTIGGRSYTENSGYKDMSNAIIDELIYVVGNALWTEDFEPPERPWR